MEHYHPALSTTGEAEALDAIKQWSYPLHGFADLDPLVERIGDAKLVLLGEATHGTHEFYAWRTQLTKRLIREKGFNFIAVEGDWPDCYNVNRFVKSYPGTPEKALDVVHSFDRWPTWLWANWETIALAEWLRGGNNALPETKKVGFYGLDVYSLWESMQSIMEYLAATDPAARGVAETAYHCFEPYRAGNGAAYARASQFVPEQCQLEVVDLLKTVRQKMNTWPGDPEEVFNIEQNAFVAVDAEQYYRTMLRGGPHGWNVRDRHMTDTLLRLLRFHGPEAKAIVWAHNTHVGDARATDMTDEGMYNIGELLRMHRGDNEVVLVGFGTGQGATIAARHWDDPMQVMNIPAASGQSWEDLLHKASPGDKLLIMDDLASNDMLMETHLGHRAIGVLYNPAYDRSQNYVPTILPMRYDAFIYLDRTTALYPLHLAPRGHNTPETYPFGM